MHTHVSIPVLIAPVLLGVVQMQACDISAPTYSEPRIDIAADQVASNPVPTSFVAEGLDQLPDEGLSDWVSYADAVVAATVIAETELPAPPEVAERGEGYVGRTIEVRIDELLWVAEGPGKEIEHLDSLKMVVFGWIRKGDQLVPIAKANSPRLEVGGEYVIPLVQFEAGWGPLTARSVVAAEFSVIAQRDAAERHADGVAKRAFAGHSHSEIGHMVSNARPSELALKYRDLRPEDRFHAVSIDSNLPVSPHPPNIPAPTQQ